MQFYFYDYEDSTIKLATRELAYKLSLGDYVTFCIYSLASIDLDIKVLVETFASGKQDRFDLIDQVLLENSDIDLVLIVRSDHSYGAYNLDEYQSRITKPWIVLDSNRLQESRSSNVVYCPQWAIMYPQHFVPTDAKSSDTGNRKYIISSLNNKPRDERLMNLTRMLEKPEKFPWANMLITMGDDFHDGIKLHATSLSITANRVRQYWSEETKKTFEQTLLPLLPIRHPDINVPAPENNVIHEYWNDAYMNSYVNLATEYDAENGTAFFSEKSMKPILAEQLFVVLGSPGTVALLRSVGFDMFDDIFGGHTYDTIPGISQRIDAVHDAIPAYDHNTWAQLYNDTAARRRENRELLLSGKIEQDFIHRLTGMIRQKLLI